MNDVIAIFVGGGMGSVARYGIGKWMASITILTFPFGTLVANLIASLILGLFLGITSGKPDTSNSIRFLIAIGFCGGFSTFSTFSAESLELLRHGETFQFALNILFNITGCIAMIGAGFWIVKTLN